MVIYLPQQASDETPLLDELTRQRRQGQRQVTRALARRGALRGPLRERDAADIVHALVSPEVYGLLVVDRGWPPARYETWLTETLVNQLLDPVGNPAQHRPSGAAPRCHTRF